MTQTWWQRLRAWWADRRQVRMSAGYLRAFHRRRLQEGEE